MKNVKSILAIIILLCMCVAGCSNSSTTNTIDYSNAIGDFPEAAVSPPESYIIDSLKQSEFVLEVEAVTKSNDPNNKLNSEGGYTSCVYFSSSLINQSDFSEKNIVDKGTLCGGCIEVYANEEDAIVRDKYLSKFDGGLLDSGSHTVIGTIIIRTSSKLNAEQQAELTKNLISIITSSNQSTQATAETTSTTTDIETTTAQTSTPPATEPATTESPTTAPTVEATKKPEQTHTHNFSKATCTDPKTCSCGATEGKAKGHSWSDATCTSPKTCQVCGTTKGSTTSHQYSNGSCYICGANDPNYTTITYVLNTNSKKFHRTTCHRLPEDNRSDTTMSRSEVISSGYDPCKICNP